MNEPDPRSGRARAVPIGDAQPNAEGDFLFEPGRGGGRMDKIELADPGFRSRYIEASHFGEVNTYFHLDRIAAYINELLRQLGAKSLPRVTAVVNAHHAATAKNGGVRDGMRRSERWLAFQGGHYRLPGRSSDPVELEAVSVDGEIHLGPGRTLLDHGALVEVAGGRYRANASHNAGIIYHEYGHHLTRHTADFRANALRASNQQSNRKTALDEGTCDYWAARSLGTPHIWAWHRRHDNKEVHPRSLTSSKTMADFDSKPEADAHSNGTIWAAALWDLRTRLVSQHPDGVLRTDLLVLKSLLLLGQLVGRTGKTSVGAVQRARGSFVIALSSLLRADEMLYGDAHREIILTAFAQRRIHPEPNVEIGRGDRSSISQDSDAPDNWAETSMHPRGDLSTEPHFLPDKILSVSDCDTKLQGLLKHVTPEEIPASDDLFSAKALEEHLLQRREDQSLSLIAVGDIMLGGRAKHAITEHGPDYPFESVLPLLRKAHIVLGNLEGPFARKARKQLRNHSYRVKPELADSLRRAGINVVTLANNHLLDCGRAGVLETLETLAMAGVAPLGAAADAQAAHTPIIKKAGTMNVGLLGYYWNPRCAATATLPGSAMDPPETLAADIRWLRDQVDRIVVTFHWGVPYVREPSSDDRAKARFAIDCGADVVVGHHAHIVQPFEVYRDCPIFHGVGNFAFGTGNSRAEGLMVGFKFEPSRTAVGVYPLYVKNRDPRVSYQPKLLRNRAAERELHRLKQMSGPSGDLLTIEGGWGRLDLPYSQSRRERSKESVA